MAKERIDVKITKRKSRWKIEIGNRTEFSDSGIPKWQFTAVATEQYECKSERMLKEERWIPKEVNLEIWALCQNLRKSFDFSDPQQ